LVPCRPPKLGIAVYIPSKFNRKVAIPYDALVYKQRHKIENMFGRLKDWRNPRPMRSLRPHLLVGTAARIPFEVIISSAKNPHVLPRIAPMSWRCGCLSIARKTRSAGIHDRCQVRYERLLVLMSILPSHCGAARAFLDIGSRRIGARAIGSSDTIADSEIGDRPNERARSTRKRSSPAGAGCANCGPASGCFTRGEARPLSRS
jgi:hypothetical protein